MSYDDLFNAWLRGETEPVPERPYQALVGPLTPFPGRTLADFVQDDDDDEEPFVCPVCHGRRTIQPVPWSPPEECPRCVDPDDEG